MNYDRLLQSIIDIGEEMIKCGAEVSRVEDSLRRMLRSYGSNRVNVFIITTNIQVTVTVPDGRIITHTREVEGYSTNYEKLDALNDLSRYICAYNPSVIDIDKMLNRIHGKPEQKLWKRFMGAIFAAGGFTMFFGGSIRDGIAASIMGIVLVLFEKLMVSRETNPLVYHFTASVVGGITAILLVKCGLGQDEGLIMIGGIMLLIPGVALTNGVRDMMVGDVVSGLLRMTNALLVAGAIACGFAFALFLMGGIL